MLSTRLNPNLVLTYQNITNYLEAIGRQHHWKSPDGTDLYNTETILSDTGKHSDKESQPTTIIKLRRLVGNSTNSNPTNPQPLWTTIGAVQAANLCPTPSTSTL
ncbi:hypothetical protein CHS0354_038687 [Potamilus streckersoni]|uniref:Uncharacterized protein n=1 Tax=Potamilus streckersoni TaxID=2493646 RepID=A0AAE0VUT4_9BIVA|nr:hypothetical protein CHS0354_038687 [Potamilus streckersoni]